MELGTQPWSQTQPQRVEHQTDCGRCFAHKRALHGSENQGPLMRFHFNGPVDSKLVAGFAVKAYRSVIGLCRGTSIFMIPHAVK